MFLFVLLWWHPGPSCLWGMYSTTEHSNSPEISFSFKKNANALPSDSFILYEILIFFRYHSLRFGINKFVYDSLHLSKYLDVIITFCSLWSPIKTNLDWRLGVCLKGACLSFLSLHHIPGPLRTTGYDPVYPWATRLKQQGIIDHWVHYNWPWLAGEVLLHLPTKKFFE